MTLSVRQNPDVFAYLDVLSYLQDYYAFRKSTDKDFSYEKWSDELGFNSRSFLRMIVIGKKKVTPKFIESFSEKRFSSKTQSDYFEYLVKYTQSKTAKDRQAYGQKLIQLLKGNQKPDLVEDYIGFISNPLLPRLFALLSFQDVRGDVQSLARLMNLTSDEITVALQKLQELELVTCDHKNSVANWRAQSSVFKVPDKYGNINLMKFHEMSLMDAIQAFHHPKETRRYKSLLLPMTPEDLKEFNAQLDAFAAEQLARYNAKTFSGKKMFQANFNIYSVTSEGGE